MTIEVVDYDPAWVDIFDELKGRYQVVLRGVEIVAVEHVGSTSVVGLAAKPVIDVDIIVQPAHLQAAITAMQAGGFESRGTLGIDDRWAFTPPADYPATNTYVIIDGSLALRNHLAVRDLLRHDPDLRSEYADLKRTIAARVDTIDDYVEQKSTFLSSLLDRAGLSPDERTQIESANKADNQGSR